MDFLGHRGFQKLAGFYHQPRQVDFPDNVPPTSRIGQQLFGQVGGFLPGHHHVLQMGADWCIGCRFAERKAGVADNARQQFIEIMSDAAGQQADTFSLLRLTQLFFQALALGDVGQPPNHAADHSAAVNRI